jgi:hypothetical protein
MRTSLALSLVILACSPVGAGELIFANGNRLAGELSNESLMVSTGSGLVEIAPDEVLALSRDEIRLRDGRVIRGTLVGGQVKARTSLGEIAVKVDELQAYRAGESGAAGAAPAAASQPPPLAVSSGAPAAPPASVPSSTAAAPATGNTGVVNGLPTVGAYQGPANDPQANATSPGVQTAALGTGSTQLSGRMYEVLGESALYRDALFSSSRVGHVVAGQQVRYVDSIDRRLRILNLLVFDGGNWIKVRVADGTEGWIPADTLREVR